MKRGIILLLIGAACLVIGYSSMSGGVLDFEPKLLNDGRFDIDPKKAKGGSLNLEVRDGDVLKLRGMGITCWNTAAGSNNCVGPKGSTYPNGSIMTASRFQRSEEFPLQNAGGGAIIMWIKGRIFSVGEETEYLVSEDGVLNIAFGINDPPTSLDGNSGDPRIQWQHYGKR